jgi:transcriptional regulator of acetoin/glycerol metabolism
MKSKRSTRPAIRTLEQAKKTAILAALKLLGGDVPLAAERLEIGKTTLYRKLREYGVTLRRRHRRQGNL